MTASIVMPAYNAAPYLAQAVRSCLGQTVRAQVIVVDDGSTDSTPELLSWFKDITVITQKNRGPAAALNRGMEEATGDIILFADADDVQEPDRVERYLESMKEVDFAYSGYWYCSIKAVPQYEVHPKPMTREALVSNVGVPGASIALSRRAYQSGIRFREGLRVNYDLGLMIDLYKSKLKYAVIDIPTFRYRMLPTGMSFSRKDEVDRVTAELISEL